MTPSEPVEERIAAIGESLGILRRIAIDRGEGPGAGTLEYIEELQRKLGSGGAYLAVLGLFKRGKSTLVNALLQSDVLPIGAVPVTSVVTLLRFGFERKAEVSYLAGGGKAIEVSELAAYVTEKGNPGNEKGVKEVEVRLPSSLLKSGITIVDTPGVGSTILAGTRTTYRFLERADACLFTLAVDPPIGSSELDLLRAIAPHAKRIIFVLNKKDRAGEDDLSESVDFCREVIGSSLGLSDVSIYPVSARLALEGYREADPRKLAMSGVPELLGVIEGLFGETREILVSSTAAKALRAADNTCVAQEVAIKAAAMPLGRLEETLKRLDDFLGVIGSRKREVFYLLDGKSKEIIQMLDGDLERFKEERRAGFLAAMESYAKDVLGSKGSAKEAMAMLERRLGDELKTAYSAFVSAEDERMAARFDELVREFRHKVDSLAGDVGREVSALFGVTAEPPSPDVSLTSESRFYYQSETLSSGGLLFVGDPSMLLPRSVVRGALLKRFMSQAEEVFEGTAGRVRYDYFVVRLDRGIVELKREVGRSLDSSTLAARNAAMEGTRLRQEGEEQRREKMEGLERALSEARSAREQLAKLAEGNLTLRP